MVTAPVPVLPEKLPVKPAGDAAAVTLMMLPLSLGATLGVTIAPPPVEIMVSAYVPTLGAVLALTVTVSVVLAEAEVLLVTVSVKLAVVAAQLATTLAVTTPESST